MEKPEQLDQTKRYFIFCGECAFALLDENSTIYLAIFGPQGLTDEDACLVCGDWKDRAFWMEPAAPYACDLCHTLVGVSQSSSWFAERHRAERV